MLCSGFKFFFVILINISPRFKILLCIYNIDMNIVKKYGKTKRRTKRKFRVNKKSRKKNINKKSRKNLRRKRKTIKRVGGIRNCPR